MTNAAKLTVIAALGLAALVLSAQAAQRSAHATKAKTPSFRISGGLRLPMRPGLSQPLNLELRNPHRVAISITRLRATVVVDAAHRRAGCTPKRDFVVRQLPARAYPLRLEARRAARLSALGRRSQLRVGMRDLPTVDQKACKGARLTLRYSGRAFPRRLARRRAAPATGRGR